MTPIPTWALILNDKIAELTRIDPTNRFHKDWVWVRVDEINPMPAVGDIAKKTGEVWAFSKPQPDPEHVVKQIAAEARALIVATDKTVLRCIENNVIVPEDWKYYRKQLRLVITNKLTSLPKRPDYPAGS